MNLIAALAVAVLWGAAVYRIIRAVRRPAGHRTALALAVSLLAAAATGHFSRQGLDALLGVPNLTNLGSRLTLAGAVAGAQFYILGTRYVHPRPRSQVIILAAAVLTMGISVVSWFLAPIHRVELPDLADAPTSAASLAYAVVIYVYTAWLLVDLTRFAHENLGRLRRDDPPAAPAVALIAAAGWTGVPVLSLFAVHTSIAQVEGHPDPYLDTVAAILFPIPLALLALGLLLMPVLPAVEHWRAASRLSSETRGLWELMLAQYPHVHLPRSQSAAVQRFTPRLTAQRQLIEISDALEERRVRPPANFEDLVDDLRKSSTIEEPTITAKEALQSVDRSAWPDPIVHLCAALTHNERFDRGHGS